MSDHTTYSAPAAVTVQELQRELQEAKERIQNAHKAKTFAEESELATAAELDECRADFAALQRELEQTRQLLEICTAKLPDDVDSDSEIDRVYADLAAAREQCEKLALSESRLVDCEIQLRNELAAARKDAERIDYLEQHPRLSEIHVNGKVEDCYLYGVAGAPGLKLREIIDAAIASEKP